MKYREWNLQIKCGKVMGSKAGMFMDAENVPVIEYKAYEKLEIRIKHLEKLVKRYEEHIQAIEKELFK